MDLQKEVENIQTPDYNGTNCGESVLIPKQYFSYNSVLVQLCMLCMALIKKSDNLWYNTLSRWVAGTFVMPSDGPLFQQFFVKFLSQVFLSFYIFHNSKKVKSNSLVNLWNACTIRLWDDCPIIPATQRIVLKIVGSKLNAGLIYSYVLWLQS